MKRQALQARSASAMMATGVGEVNAPRAASGERDDRVGAGGELGVDVGAGAAFVWGRRRLGLSGWVAAPVEDDLDLVVTREALLQVLVQLGVAAGDDEEGPGHGPDLSTSR